MSFDTSSFMKQKFEVRTDVVPVPALAAFFKGKEEANWKVRGQTASEISVALEYTHTSKSIDSIIKAIGSSSNQIKELKKAIGLSNEVPDDIKKRLQQLVTCSVEPECDMPMAVKLAEVFPIEFYTLTNKILMLTGLGMDIPKSVASGKIKK